MHEEITKGIKVLYITMLNTADKNGGFVYRWAIGKALSAIVGSENLDIITSELDNSEWKGNIIYRIKHYTSAKEKILNLLNGNITQIGQKDVRVIEQIVLEKHYDIVVFGCSETGNMIKRVKKTGVKTISLYNDIIADSVDRKLQLEKKISYVPIAILEKRAEKMDIKYCDVKVALNERDSNTMYKHYKKKADFIIPICIEDSYYPTSSVKQSDSNELKLLFVGSYGWSANPEGILWFCNNVMPHLSNKVKLQIAGFGMEKICEEPIVKNNPNIDVIGSFDNINDLYSSVDIVVAPILTGTGMKTKTAEALMHGKCILASPEALEGYNSLDEFLCRSAEDYIQKISYYCNNRPERFIDANRKMYEENYSVEAMKEKLKYLLVKK